MHSKRKLFASLTVIALSLVAVALAALLASNARAAETTLPAQPKIHIFSCQVATAIDPVPAGNGIGLGVRFQNDSPDELSEIVWRAKYGSGYIDFRVPGKYSPGIRIDNFVLFDLGRLHFHPQEYASFTDASNCSVVGATRSSDGATWTDESAPKEHYLLPTPGPSPNATLAPPGVTKPNDPLDIAHCNVVLTKQKGGLIVAFRNRDASRAIGKVVFRASYGLGTMDFEDTGTFLPDAYIKHTLTTDPPMHDRTYDGFDDPGACSVVSVDYTDGTSWKNTALPPTSPLPPPVSGALNLLDWASQRWANSLAFPTPTPSPTPSSTPPSPP